MHEGRFLLFVSQCFTAETHMHISIALMEVSVKRSDRSVQIDINKDEVHVKHLT